MATPTIDHQDQPSPGACACNPRKLCPACLGKLQRERHEFELKQWVEGWGNQPRVTPCCRPLLRLVPGGR